MDNQALLAQIFNPKEFDIKLEETHESKDEILQVKKPQNKEDFVSSILDQDHDNVIDFFENVDPMLAWALLKSKILPQVGMFDLLAERSKLKTKESSEPVNVVKMLLDEFDALVSEVIAMIQCCCESYDSSHDQVNSIQLNPSLSLRKFALIFRCTRHYN